MMRFAYQLQRGDRFVLKSDWPKSCMPDVVFVATGKTLECGPNVGQRSYVVRPVAGTHAGYDCVLPGSTPCYDPPNT